MITIQREPISRKIFEELYHLVVENHLAAHPRTPFALDDALMLAMPLSVWVVRDDGQPIGYCAHLVHHHTVTSELVANCAAIYVRPTYPFVPFRLLRLIERDLAGEVTSISYSAPHMSDASVFLESMGYGCKELVMEKCIDRC